MWILNENKMMETVVFALKNQTRKNNKTRIEKPIQFW